MTSMNTRTLKPAVSTTIASQPTPSETCDTLLRNLALKLKSKQYCEQAIKAELDSIADKIIEHLSEPWVLDCFGRFYDIHAFYFGLTHQNTINALINYAFIHLHKQNIEIAIALFKDAYLRIASQFGKYSTQAVFVLETLVDVYQDNKMQDQYEESLLSLYFVYKRLYLNEHANTKETKAELILQLAGWTSLTGLDQRQLDVIQRAETIASQLPESQRLNAFKSEIYTYFKNAFKEIQKHPQAIENLNEMMKQFMENREASYDELNAHLVSHAEHPPKIYTTAVFTIKDRVYFCEYTVNNDENREHFQPITELIVRGLPLTDFTQKLALKG